MTYRTLFKFYSFQIFHGKLISLYAILIDDCRIIVSYFWICHLSIMYHHYCMFLVQIYVSKDLRFQTDQL